MIAGDRAELSPRYRPRQRLALARQSEIEGGEIRELHAGAAEADREAAARSILGIPADVIPLALVPVGEPAGPAEPKDKFDPARIRRERW